MTVKEFDDFLKKAGTHSTILKAYGYIWDDSVGHCVQYLGGYCAGN
jgi:hypothetical protein